MNENIPAPENTEENIPVPEEAEGVIITIDDDDLGPDGDELEKSVIAEINARKSNIEEYVPPKMGPIKWLENFWYRNKTLILIAAAFIFVAAYVIITAIPGQHDITFSMYVSYTDFPSTIQDEVNRDLEVYCDDWDKNGELSAYSLKFDLTATNDYAAAMFYGKVYYHLNGEPETMIWIVDDFLYEMMIDGYGEEFFDSYNGAPKWIEITWNDYLNTMIDAGSSPRLGICLLHMTDKHKKDKDLVESYETALLFLENLCEAHPEIYDSVTE